VNIQDERFDLDGKVKCWISEMNEQCDRVNAGSV
jgi:hypothetical protein